MTDGHRKRDFAISSGWVLVMVIPLCVLVLWIAIDHANAGRDRLQDHANQQFRQALILTDRKFQQALRIQAALFAYSTNKSVCGFRGLVKPQLRRAVERRSQYPTLTKAARALNENAITTTHAFLDSQVTIPSGFDCKTLPKRPPKATP